MKNSIMDYLEVTASMFPNKVSLMDENSSVTFSEMRKQALLIANDLIDIGTFRKPIVVYMEKSISVLISFFGIAYSGNFYCPIDSEMPESRITKILDTLKPEVVITNNKCLDACCRFFDNANIVNIDSISSNGRFEEKKVLDVTAKVVDTDILYVLFTSGSTGTPKGVTISHRAVIDYTEWVTETFDITEEEVIGNQAPFYFDNSILDIYQMLKTGATLNIIPQKYFAFPAKLLEYLDTNRINFIFWVPSALCLVANRKVLNKIHLDYLRKVLFCGEVMPCKQLNMWRQEYPSVLFANLYGPTEITDVCTYYIVNRNFLDDDSLPIGKPCKNMDVIVVGDDDEVVEKVGEIGELYVRGTGVSYGYYNDFERTNKAFVQNPSQRNIIEKVYKTGDLVYYNELGELIYVGRIDDQIKHNGHRIELGEIETAINAIENIEKGACIYDYSRNEIVAFFVGNISDKDIRDSLSENLPKYMIPHRFMALDKMPLNDNGKTNKRKLKEEFLNET